MDPGGTTGWVVMGAGGEVESWGEERDQQRFLTDAWDLIRASEVVVVVERWVTMRGRAFTNEPSAQEIIGALRWMAEYNLRVFRLQGASDAKAFGTKERLARHAEVGRGGGGHARMALSHAMLHRETWRGTSR